MSLDPELLELLACPSEDHAPLREETTARVPRWSARYLRLALPDRGRHPGAAARRGRPGPARARRRRRRVSGMFDEELLDDEDQLQRRDETRLLWHLATAGAQVRRAVELYDEVGFERLRGEVPRSLLVATDAPPSSALRLLTRLSCEATPALAWHGVELPRWAGAVRRVADRARSTAGTRAWPSSPSRPPGAGWRMAVVAPADSPVASAAGRAPMHQLPTDLHPHAARWAVLTPLLQALDALGVHVGAARAAGPRRRRAGRDGRALPAERRAVHQSGQVAGRRVRRRPPDHRRRGRARERRGARHRRCAAARGRRGGRRGVACPTAWAAPARCCAAPARRTAVADFFRDRVEEAGPPRARLLVIGDDGDATDSELGDRSGAQIQLDEVAARRAAGGAAPARRRARRARVEVDVPDGPPLARFAAATAFGEFTAAYLAFGLGLDPGAPRPAELAH